MLVAMVISLFFAPTPASAAPIVPLRPELGHVLVVTDEAQVYVRTDEQSVIFSALLPADWSYAILVDGDQNGVWGDGAYRQGNHPISRTDFTYAESAGGICTQYIYSAYPDDLDKVYASSPCGDRESAATLQIAPVSDTLSLQTFRIPKSEMRDGAGDVHFAVEIWNGAGSYVYGSPSAPYVLLLTVAA